MSGRGRIWRSMPLRLAVSLVALFTVVALLSLAASYAVTQASFEESIRADLRQDLAGFRAAPTSRAVALLVEAESQEADPNRLILSYVSPSGRIYGNGAIARDAEGFHIFSLDRERAEYRGAYLSLTDRLHGGLITIARSRAEMEALWDVFVNILLISLLPTILIALSGGLILARRSNRHVEVIGGALGRMTGGDLGARVEIGPRWSDDLRQIGGAVNQMATAQQSSVAALKQVSSDIAHDLRTPLQRVAVRLDDLRSEVAEGSVEAALVEKTQGEVAEMGQVFNALLQLAQMQASTAREQFVVVDLGDVARTLVEMFEPLAAEQGQKLTLEAAGSAFPVEGDPTLLGQTLSNLIENALRHAGEGAEVVVSLHCENTGVVLIVADDGPGVPAGEREKVLQRLYRLDRSRNTPGHGLGLSLVAAAAKLHGAVLELGDAGPGLRVSLEFQKERKG